MTRRIQTSSNPREIRLNRVAKAIIRRALREDLGKRGDITCRATIPTDKTGTAHIIAKSDGIIAGLSIAGAVFNAIEKSIKIKFLVQDGQMISSGTEIAHISGKLWAILAAERTALNILGRCSGIATLTDQYVKAVEGTRTSICETRKTAPGLRYLDKAAVKAGGGVNHRYALHDAFLIKENHISAVGGIAEAIKACKEFAEKHGRFQVMVEARNYEEFREALEAEPDRILLDNMTYEEIRRCVEERTGQVKLEATGGIDIDSVRKYAEQGVDYISIGALTNSVKVMDLSLLVLDVG